MNGGSTNALLIAFGIVERDYRFRQSLEQQRSQQVESESVLAPLVRLLVIHGARLTEVEADYGKGGSQWLAQLYNDAFHAWESSATERPRKLTALTRTAIRAHLATVKKLHRVEEMPLPQDLLDYVMVKYV